MKENRDKKIVVFQLLVLMFFCARCFAIEDEIGNPTVPPSSVKRGLVRTPNPIDASGNLAVTGNVSGEAYFHGLVPYRATTQFGAPLGSEDIGSFLRRSAPVSSARSQFLPQPYYLPSSTVGSIATSGTGAVLTYPSIRDNKGTGEFVIPEAPKVEKRAEIPAASPLYDYSRTRPLSYEPTDLERVISYDLIREKNKKDLSIALQRASEGLHKSISEDKQAQQSAQRTLSVPEPTKPMERFEPPEPLQPGKVPAAEAEKPASKDVYEQMLEDAAKTPQPQQVSQPAQQQTAEQKQGQVAEPREKGPSDLRSELAEIEKETAEAVVGVHKSFATQAKDKFNYYMRTAEEFLKQGKYYHAVDAYILASIYKPDDPLAYAGRSHALFASGEYVSSAYFLARAVNIFPQYVNFKIDLNAMIPDKDRLESRITDVKQWIAKTGSAELSFLLAYIYYQLDKPDLATGAIKLAVEKMPDSAAVKALKQAIEKKSR
jgi:tetratricopeptide (TPR) repeat protein